MGNLGFVQQLGLGDYIVSILLGIIVFVWAWQILWVTKDISSRSDNLFLQLVSILVSVVLLPIIGLMVYILFRPVYYKYEKNGWRESLLLQTLECDNCLNINLTDFDYCIYCGEDLKTQCKECKTSYPYSWDYCSKCGAPNFETLQE